MRKFEYEGKEDRLINLLQEMLKDNGWTQEEIDRYVIARIE